jgi:succinate dehydrogenase / fumarate reductase flavoprotein subunit
MDMEMFQFHPTGMVFPEEAEGLLITEATRGEGGILTNSKGERFMEKYDPERMELSARDIVARANYLEVEAGRGTEHGGVYLDISHKGKKYILERLPSIYEQYFCYTGKDISKEKMEVGPTAHYSMGGIYIDHATGQLLQAASNKVIIQNLYAIGEVGAGVHGGNRLGGNSLAEILVFGRLVGKHLVKQLSQMNLISIDKQLVQEKIDALQHLHQDNGEDPIEAKKELQQVMWKHVGVIREAKGMETGLQELESFQMKKFSIGSVFKRNKKLIAALDYRNMLPTCEMIIRSALMRTESRAAHYRRDYLETREKWKKNILCTPKNNTIELTTRPIPEVPEGIREKILEERQKSQQLVE